MTTSSTGNMAKTHHIPHREQKELISSSQQMLWSMRADCLYKKIRYPHRTDTGYLIRVNISNTDLLHKKYEKGTVKNHGK